MHMSDGERLIAAMLAEVMEVLEVNKELDPTLIKTLVFNNDGWAIKDKYPFIFESEAPEEGVVKETRDILWMFGIIENSIRLLSGEEADEAKGWLYNHWRGFDGNNDPHYGVASTMIETLGEFDQSRKGINLNSHSQSSLPRYRRMLEKFDGYIRSSRANPLSFTALKDLCS